MTNGLLFYLLYVSQDTYWFYNIDDTTTDLEE